MFNTLQTDPSIPMFATTAEPEDLSRQESMFRDNEVAEALIVYEDREFTDSDKQRWRGPLTPVGSAEDTSTWGLEVLKGGNIKIATPGTIIKDAVDISDQLTISNIDDEFTPAAGKALYLKVSDIEPTSCELVLDDELQNDPSRYELEETEGEDDEFKSYREPLYFFIEEDEGDTTGIGDGLYAQRAIGPYHLEIIHTFFRKNTASNWITAPKFVASHRAMPKQGGGA